MTASNRTSASALTIAERLRGFGPLGVAAVLVIVAGGLAGPLVGAVLVLSWSQLSATPLVALGLPPTRNWTAMLVQGVTLGVVLKVVAKALVLPLLHAPPINASYHYLEHNAAALPGIVATVLVSASVGEEVLFRGYLFERLGRLLGRGHAALSATVLLSTTLFALAHYPDQRWPGVQQAVVTGLVFGGVFAWRGQLGLVIIAHAAYDLTAIALIYNGWEVRVAQLLFS